MAVRTVVRSGMNDETAAATESTPALADLPLTPKTAIAYVELSRKVVRQSTPSVDALIMTDLGGVLAQASDVAALNGSGASGQPLGILNTPGISTFTGASLDLAALTNAQQDLADANASVNDASLGYATTPAVAALLKAKQRFSGSSTGLWEGSVNTGMVEGVRAMSSTQMPAATAIYGDWSQLLIGSWGILEVSTNPYENFQAGIIGVRAMWSVDIALRHVESFSVATSIT